MPKLRQTTKAPVRKNLSKQEIKEQLDYTNKVQAIKDLVRKIFPVIEPADTIYDAQTVVNALSGFIAAHIEKKLSEIKLSDIEIDLSKEGPSKVKTQILELIDMLKDEPAKELSATLERLGKTLAEYSCSIYMKNPMSEIKVTDIVSD